MSNKKLTLIEAKNLSYGDMVYSIHYNNADQSPQRFRVNGRPHIWKTRPENVRVPVKRGLYQFGYIDQDNMSEFSLSEEYATSQ